MVDTNNIMRIEYTIYCLCGVIFGWDLFAFDGLI